MYTCQIHVRYMSDRFLEPILYRHKIYANVPFKPYSQCTLCLPAAHVYHNSTILNCGTLVQLGSITEQQCVSAHVTSIVEYRSGTGKAFCSGTCRLQTQLQACHSGELTSMRSWNTCHLLCHRRHSVEIMWNTKHQSIRSGTILSSKHDPVHRMGYAHGEFTVPCWNWRVFRKVELENLWNMYDIMCVRMKWTG